MYQDNESIHQFERQHARDRLAEMARTLSDDPDTDLMTGHSATERRAGMMSVVISFVAAIGLGVLLYLIATSSLDFGSIIGTSPQP